MLGLRPPFWVHVPELIMTSSPSPAYYNCLYRIHPAQSTGNNTHFTCCSLAACGLEASIHSLGLAQTKNDVIIPSRTREKK